MRPISKRTSEPVQVSDYTGKLPDFPMELNYLWRWFQEISLGLGVSGFGFPTITWDTLLAWCQLMHKRLEPWEVNTIVQLGALRAGIYAKKGASKTTDDNAQSDRIAREPKRTLPGVVTKRSLPQRMLPQPRGR